MNDQLHIDGDTRAGTIGGTLVVILLNVFTHDALKSALLAFVGATVSFFVSLGWKFLIRHSKSRRARRAKNQDNNKGIDMKA